MTVLERKWVRPERCENYQKMAAWWKDDAQRIIEGCMYYYVRLNPISCSDIAAA